MCRWNPLRGAGRVALVVCLLALLVPSTAAGSSVALFVDRPFQDPLRFEIDRLAADIERDLPVTVLLEVVEGATITPAALRARIKELHATRELIGIVLIGDLPAARLGDYPAPGIDVAATDAYYEDLDDYCWLDADGNGVFNSVVDADGDGDFDWILKNWIAEHNREVWSGRLQPPSGPSYAERVEMLRRYLDRNHAYRTGPSSYRRGMVYAESVRHNGDPSDGEDDRETIYARALAMMDGSWLFDRSAGDILDFVWSDDIAQHMELWRAGVNRAYEYGVINVHGTATAQWFGGTNWLTSASYGEVPANTLFVDFASCSNGDFSAAGYLAGWALFAGEALAVRANTRPVMQVGTLGPDPDLRLLSLGLTLGDLRIAHVLGNEFSVLFGDPTLRLRAPGGGSRVSADRDVIVFPEGAAPDVAAEAPDPAAETASLAAAPPESGYVLLTNEGPGPVNVYRRVTSLDSRDHRYPWGGLASGFDVVTPFPLVLWPGQTRAVRVDFSYDGLSGRGTYRAAFLLYTDSPATPYLWIGAEKTVLTNTAPVAEAGPDRLVEQENAAGARVTLDGSKSYDADGDPIIWLWTWSGGSATGATPAIMLPPGRTEVTLVVNDGSLDSAPDHLAVTVVDTTPPVVHVPGPMGVIATRADGAIVPFTATAEDAVSGAIAPDCAPASGSVFPPGDTRVTCSARDGAGNVGTAWFDIRVRFDWSGVLPPVDPAGRSVFKLGSTIPVKFRLAGDSAAIQDLRARIVVTRMAGSILGTVEAADAPLQADTGNTFRYDPREGQYIFNLGTADLSAGTWIVGIDLGDRVEHPVRISLRP